jgi:glycosyltransferase involved in cell wall biosynthesis
MIILIPAYEPDTKLVDLLAAIRAEAPAQEVVVVNDGSGPAYQPIFDAAYTLGCTVLHHPRNRGKGAALKTGFAHIAHRWPGEDVVCADCDGQHRLGDIQRVAEALEIGSSPIVLGSRAFDGQVPLRSRFGNSVTRVAFAVATGRRITDTQTGLRAYRAELLEWLGRIGGDRFEYELNVLLEARQCGIDLAEVPIETVYLDHNASSHFRPLVDSARIYAPLVRFAMSSLGAFVVDFVTFVALIALGGGLAVSVVAARALSASFNYATNRRFVFNAEAGGVGPAARYAGLVVLLLVANYSLLRLLAGGLSLNVVVAKLLTEVTLFLFSYLAQQRFVFAPTSGRPRLGSSTAPSGSQQGSGQGCGANGEEGDRSDELQPALAHVAGERPPGDHRDGGRGEHG